MLGEACALAVLAAASIYDAKYRDVPALLMGLGVVCALAGSAVDHYLLGVPQRHLGVYWAVSAIVLGVAGALVLARMMGEGDLAAFAVIAAGGGFTGLSAGGSCLFPLVFTSLAYYAFAMLALGLANAVYNLVYSRSLLRGLPRRVALVYLFTARPVEARRLARRPGWWYPLSLCGEHKLTFNIYENPEDTARRVKEAMTRGCLRPSDMVWASYGVPALIPITVGYTVALLVGDEPIVALAALIAGGAPICLP